MTAPYIKVAGTWKIAQSAWVKLGGEWKSWFAIAVGFLDTAFTTNNGTGAIAGLWSVVVQPDGKILVGGEFTAWDGVTVGRIVRLNADGTRDTAFTTNTGTGPGVGPLREVLSVATQSDGKILVGGPFTTWNGVTVNRIVRLNADGTRDTAFTTNVGTAASGAVRSITVQPDGKILVGGDFSAWNGVTVNRIVRLNADGTRDTAFTTNTGTAAGSTVYSISLQLDGKILVGGLFTTWDGVTVGRIVRLNADGTRDTAFTTNVGTAANSGLWSFFLQPDGKILVGGEFTAWDGVTVNRIVRLNADGTRDTAFTTNVGTAGDNAVRSISLQPDGKILVGGLFTAWDGVTVNRIVRLNADGTRDTAFTTNVGTAAGAVLQQIKVQPDGKILVGGFFTTWNGATVGRIARLI
jgi:uncharacterized delta-60 repeat protein